MELIEWATFLRTLQLKFEGVTVAERGLTEQRNRNQALYTWQDHWLSPLIYIFQARCTLTRKVVQEAVHMDIMVNTISNFKLTKLWS